MFHLQLVMCAKGPPKTSVRQIKPDQMVSMWTDTMAAQVVDLIFWRIKKKTGYKSARSYTKLKNEILQEVMHKHILFTIAKLSV